MSRPQQSRPEKIEVERTALVDCLAAVEAAVEDLQPRGLWIERASVVKTPLFRHRLQNRILMAALTLQRLEAAAKRLAKRLGHDTQSFNRALGSSVPIQVTSRLANSWKHGLGGQNKNATFLNGVLAVARLDAPRDAASDERLVVLGMLIADSTGGAFASGTLLFSAVRQWGALLQPFLPDEPAWAERVFPEPKGPIVNIPQGVHAAVPPGATAVFAIPEELSAEMAKEAKRRGDSA